MESSQLLFFGRQPIVDQKLNLFGYELLFIDNEEKNIEPHDYKETAKLITSTLNLEGLERVVGHSKAFVRIDEDFLLHDMILSVPLQSFIFQIQADMKFDDAIMQRISELFAQGYQFALEVEADFFEEHEALQNLLSFITFVRVGMNTINEIGRSNALAALKLCQKNILIKDIERKEEVEFFKEFENCYFQGYFFTKSEMIQPELANVESEAIISLCNMLSLEKSTEEIIDGFNKAPSMSIQLIQYLNSSAFHIKVPVDNIEKIVVLMGRENLRRWLLLTLYSVSAEGASPNPILHMVAQRIDLLTELELIIHPEVSKERLSQINFLGLLSLIDVVLHIPMDEIMSRLSINDELKAALMHHEGDMGELLAFTIAIETFDILPVQEFIAKHGLSPKAFEAHLIRSIENANTLVVQ